MLFYDTDIFNPTPATPPAPLSDAAYQERLGHYNIKIAEYKLRIEKAFSRKKAKRFETEMLALTGRNTMPDLDFDSWKGLFDSIADVYAQSCLLAQIRFTGKKYKPNGWTKEELDEKIAILGIDEQGKYYIYEAAGYDYPKPEWMRRMESMS